MPSFGGYAIIPSPPYYQEPEKSCLKLDDDVSHPGLEPCFVVFCRKRVDLCLLNMKKTSNFQFFYIKFPITNIKLPINKYETSNQQVWNFQSKHMKFPIKEYQTSNQTCQISTHSNTIQLPIINIKKLLITWIEVFPSKTLSSIFEPQNLLVDCFNFPLVNRSPEHFGNLVISRKSSKP